MYTFIVERTVIGLCRTGGGERFEVYHLFSHLVFCVEVWGGTWFSKHLQPEQYFPACEGVPATQTACTS